MKSMLHFECDYACGAAQPVLRALMETNGDNVCGYGQDEYCQRARQLILQKCQSPEAAVHFVTGGTQANLTVIAAALRPFEGALCADTGHINVHETGAIEATGHKVLPLPGQDGKITAAQVQRAMETHRSDPTAEHTVRPGLVYISHPTELGALYTRQELSGLSAVCRRLGLYLYVDGARLGYALAAEPEVDLPFLSRCCDAFTIGGTKAGMLFGEAIVLCNPKLNEGFRYQIKQRGGLLAKGRLLGVQFEAMLRQNEYTALCGRANELAQRVKQAFEEYGCPMLADTRTNQIFPIVPNRVLKKLSETVCFSSWQPMDETHTAVRFCTSATTRAEEVEALLDQLRLCF